MKIAVEKANLSSALGRVARVVETRNTYPILANVLLDAKDGRLSLRATDLDIEITESIPAVVSVPGVTTVPAKTLASIVSKMDPGAEISLEVLGEKAIVKSGRSRIQLATLSPDSFPDLKSGIFAHEFTIAASALLRLIGKTSFAISTEETRYYLNGIYMHAIEVNKQQVLRAVATDGHRMARCEMAAPDGASGMPGIIVPRKTVGELQKMLSGLDIDVGVEISETKMRFTIGETVLLSKLIEGTFPDYERVTPKANNKVVTLTKSGLAKALDRVSIIASDHGGKCVKFAFGESALTLEVTNPDHGTANEEIDLSDGIGDFEIGFNARYTQDILGALGTDRARFAFYDAGSPTLISDEDDPSALYVLMPMRV